MMEIYNSVDVLKKKSTRSKAQEIALNSVRRKGLFSYLTLFFAVFSFVFTQGQTTLISPTGDGGFSNGATFAANGWTNASSANNPWVVGTAVATAPISGNSAYISNDGGVTNAYTPDNNASNFFWRDITVPAGETIITLTFNWMCQGESTWDNWQVFYAPTTVTPVGSTTHPGSGATNVPAGITGATWLANGNLQGTVQTATVSLPASLAGTTFRLIFSWKNETGGVQPPASIDNISLTSRAPGNFISIVTGNWGSPSTWDANAVPTGADNAVVATGHTVTLDATGQSINNLTVQGILAYGTTPTTFNVNGNLSVDTAGLISVFNGTTGKTLVVTGNIVNNGAIDLSVGTTTAGNLTLNGSAVQSISGTGSFTGNKIRNLIFNNTATAIPNINWGFNDISVEYNLNISNAKINLNGNKFIYGTAIGTAGNTFTITNGGFINGTFARWWTAGGTGYTTGSPTTIPTGQAGRYPFYTPTGEQRIFYLGRTSPTAGGKYAVTYNNATTTTTGLSIVDGAYTVTNRWDGNFVVTLDGTTPAATSYWTTLFTPNAFVTTAAGAHVVGQSASISGAHFNTASAPYGQRSGVSEADLTSASGLYLGVNAADVPFASVTSGPWSSASTWNLGTVPTCTDVVFIASGHTVTSTASGNIAKNITINAGGTLEVSAGDLTVGCTLYNNTLTNNGTLTVSGGTLNVNGSITHNASAIFNQSGGSIVIDGNDAGVTANSATSYHLNLLAAVNWTGGTLTIVDPSASTTSTDVFYYNTSVNSDVSPAHTIIFGNGISTDAGGNTIGFKVNTYASSGRINFGNGIVNTGTGTNRILSGGTYTNVYRGSLTINANSEYSLTNSLSVAGDIVNNGTLTNTGTLFLQSYSGTTSSVNPNAQVISGTGIFRNATTATVNIATLTVNNNNATGVTLNVPLSVSGTLNLTSGFVNTTNTNILSLGTTTAAGTLNGGSTVSYVKGPFARTIASGNANTNYILLPVGKTAYAPVWVAPATTAVSIMKGEAFDSNSGTADASIISLAANRRWEAPLVSGTITNINVKVGDANLVATNIPVQAPAAAGAYSSAFGPIATFAAGTAVVPNTIQSNTVVTSANYTGFLSYAVSNACSGTPTPGATTATAATICLGGSTTLGITNIPAGTGLTYQWQSSLDGTTYTDIASATSVTYTATPTAATYYQCVVTCATGPASGTSTPIQITFTNNVTGTTPATRCGTGTVDLAATTSSGTIKWYTASTGGASVATGSPFTTPSISADTTYYVAAETTTPTTIFIGNDTALTGTTTQPTAFINRWPNYMSQTIYTAAELTAAGLAAGNITSMAYNISTLGDAATNANFTVKIGATTLNAFSDTTYLSTAAFTTVYGPSTYTHTASGWQTITFTSPYVWDGVSNIVVYVTHDGADAYYNSQTYYTTTTDNKLLYSYNYTTVPAAGTTSTQRLNIAFAGQAACSSPRVPVVATVTTPPAIALSAPTATICNGATSSAITITTGATDYDAYVWTPSTGVSGDATNGWTFNPTASTTYTLAASQSTGSMCATTVTFSVTVNPTPSAIVIAPSPANVCVNNIQALTATGGTIGSTVTATVGNATTLTGATVEPTAFCNRWKHYWVQMVYTAAELNALGFTAGNITALKFNITTLGDGTNVTDFKVRMGNTTNATLTAFTTTGLTQVYGTATYTHAIGENTITFDTPYAWDGVSNIIVDMRQTGQDITNNSQTYYTATAGNTVVWARTSTTTSSDGFPATNPAATTSVNRLNTTFVVSSSQPTTFAWTPTTDLYTDSAATTAYTGENLTTVYIKSSTPGSTVYTATSTSALGCPTSSTVTVNVNALPVAPTASATVQPTCTVTTGTIEVTAPTGAYEYSVDGTTYQASTTFAGLAPGTYSVTVKDTATGCVSAVTSVTINAIPAAPAAPTASATVQPTCTVPTGTIEVTAPTGAYEYSVDGTTYQASTTFAGLAPGAYSVTVRDTATGCVSAVTSVTINAISAAPAAPTASATVQPTCTVPTGTIEVTAPTGAYEYSVDDTTYQASTTFVGLAPGAYSVTVRDTATGCVSAVTSVTINAIPAAPAAPTASATVQPTCMVPTGTIVVTAPTGAYEYSVDGTTYQASTTFTGLAPGTYNVTVRDTATGCVSSATSVTIDAVPTAPAAPTVTVTQPTCSVSTGTIQFTSPLGTAYLYSVDGLNYTDASTTFSGLVPGTYNASVYNFDTGCVSGNTTVIIDVAPAGPDAPTGSATQSFTVAALTDATIDNLVATGTNIVWYPTEADALAGTNAITTGTQIFDGVTYYATQNVGGCTSTTALAVTVTVTLGMNGFDASSFKYYPNPVSDKLNIEYSSNITDVELFNAIGQLIAKTSNDATTVGIDMSRYASGTYIVKVTMENAVKTIKVVKN